MEAAGVTPQLFPIEFIPGCNTAPEVTRAQLMVNVERALPWLEMDEPHDRELVIVAGGPSLKRNWQWIETHGADILALNNAYTFLLDKGVVPDYFMLLDAREDNVEFVRKASQRVTHFIAAQAHPAVFDALKWHPTVLYLTSLPDTLELTAHIDKPKRRLMGPVGTVGMKALSLAYALGYRKLRLYGYDSSYEHDEHHAFEQKLNDTAKTIEVHLDGKRYVTTPTMAHQVNEFCALAAGMARMGITIDLHCEGLLPDMVAHCNRLGETPLAEREQAKYEEMWTHDMYRKVAPGTAHAAVAALALGAKRLDTFIDFGCGSGMGAMRLQGMGYRVTGVDFASNCRNEHCDFAFVQACLWEMPKWLEAKFGFCTDVMEHIPTERVEQVLEGIASRVEACYFNIATRDDVGGKLIGRTLHMTVMDAASWRQLLERFWCSVEVTDHEERGEAIFVCKQYKRASQ